MKVTYTATISADRAPAAALHYVSAIKDIGAIASPIFKDHPACLTVNISSRFGSVAVSRDGSIRLAPPPVTPSDWI